MERLNKILTKYIEPIKRPLSGIGNSKKIFQDNTGNNSSEMARLSIDLLVEDHKRLKTAASLMGMSMKDLVVVSIGDFMYRRLNRVTKKKSALNNKNKQKILPKLNKVVSE